MKNFKRIGIIGLGPLGSTILAFFKGKNFEVYPFEKNPLLKKSIEERGIKIIGEKNIKIEPFKLKDELKEIPFEILDFLIIATKAYDLKFLKKELPPLVFSIPFVLVQNGLNLEKELGKNFKFVFRFIPHFAVFKKGEGEVFFKEFKKLNYLGGREISLGEKITKTFNKANLKTVYKKNIDYFIWEKVILNSLLNPLSAILKKNMEEILKIKDIKSVIKEILKEAIKVAGKEKIVFNKNFERYALNYIKRGEKHFPSMYFDLMKNKETEIDFLNGKIADLGKKYKVETPMNDFIRILIKNYGRNF